MDANGAASLEALGTVVADIAATVGPAVVSIGRDGRGTGFVVAEGRVLTSAHNVRDETVAVGFADGRNVQGRLHGVDADGDLAVLDVDTGGVAPVPFADATPSVGAPERPHRCRRR